MRLFLLLSIFSLLSCRRTDVVLFEIPIGLNFEIQAGLGPLIRHFFIVRDVPTNIANLRRQFGIGDEQSIRILAANAIYTTPFQALDLGFIQEVGIRVFTTDIDRDKDAFLTESVPINAGSNVFVLPFDDDLQGFLDRPNVNFKVYFRFRSPPPTFVESRIEMRFTVH